jgi:hypothetical protein
MRYAGNPGSVPSRIGDVIHLNLSLGLRTYV